MNGGNRGKSKRCAIRGARVRSAYSFRADRTDSLAQRAGSTESGPGPSRWCGVEFFSHLCSLHDEGTRIESQNMGAQTPEETERAEMKNSELDNFRSILGAKQAELV